jgi:hypothetical protein
VQFGGQTPLKISTALQKALDDNPIPTASGRDWVGTWISHSVDALPVSAVYCAFPLGLPDDQAYWGLDEC